MRNFVQKGDIVTVIAPASVTSGSLVAVGALVGVAASDADNGTEVEIQVEGVFTVPKVATDVVAQGDLLYYDAVTGKLTRSPGTNSKPLVGAALSTAGNGVNTVDVLLMPTGHTGPAA